MIPLLARLAATAAILGAYLAQLMLLADLGHLPRLMSSGLGVEGARARWGITGPWLGMMSPLWLFIV